MIKNIILLIIINLSIANFFNTNIIIANDINIFSNYNNKNKKIKQIPNINNNNRQIVLKEELQHEQKALLDTVTFFAHVKKTGISNGDSYAIYHKKLKILIHDIKVHKKNIDMLTKSLDEINLKPLYQK